MANKFTGVTKAAIAGAVFGSAVGMVAVPRAHHKKNRRSRTIAESTSNTLRTVGTAMQNVADIIGR